MKQQEKEKIMFDKIIPWNACATCPAQAVHFPQKTHVILSIASLQ